MKKFSYVIKDSQGIHARPAGIVVAEAKKYTSSIVIKAHGKSSDLKKIFGVMGLCIKCGDEVVVETTGSDEDAASKAIETVLKNNL